MKRKQKSFLDLHLHIYPQHLSLTVTTGQKWLLTNCHIKTEDDLNLEITNLLRGFLKKVENMLYMLLAACDMGLISLNDSGLFLNEEMLTGEDQEYHQDDPYLSDSAQPPADPTVEPSQEPAQEPAQEPSTEPQEDDADGDGFTESQGDCDDTLYTVNPNAVELCDGNDNNCNGNIDEIGQVDSYEPNNTISYPVGSFDNLDEHWLMANLHNPMDQDRYEFYISDGWWENFEVDVHLTSLSNQVDYVMELWYVEDPSGAFVGQLDISDVGGYNGNERIVYSGIPFIDDAGWYEIVVYSSSGGGCDSDYELDFDFGM